MNLKIMKDPANSQIILEHGETQCTVRGNYCGAYCDKQMQILFIELDLGYYHALHTISIGLGEDEHAMCFRQLFRLMEKTQPFNMVLKSDTVSIQYSGQTYPLRSISIEDDYIEVMAFALDKPFRIPFSAEITLPSNMITLHHKELPRYSMESYRFIYSEEEQKALNMTLPMPENASIYEDEIIVDDVKYILYSILTEDINQYKLVLDNGVIGEVSTKGVLKGITSINSKIVFFIDKDVTRPIPIDNHICDPNSDEQLMYRFIQSITTPLINIWHYEHNLYLSVISCDIAMVLYNCKYVDCDTLEFTLNETSGDYIDIIFSLKRLKDYITLYNSNTQNYIFVIDSKLNQIVYMKGCTDTRRIKSSTDMMDELITNSD